MNLLKKFQDRTRKIVPPPFIWSKGTFPGCLSWKLRSDSESWGKTPRESIWMEHPSRFDKKKAKVWIIFHFRPGIPNFLIVGLNSSLNYFKLIFGLGSVGLVWRKNLAEKIPGPDFFERENRGSTTKSAFWRISFKIENLKNNNSR